MKCFSNRVRTGWALAVVALILAYALVPAVQAVTHTATLRSQEWFLAAGAAIAGTFWREVREWLSPPDRRRPFSDGQSTAVQQGGHLDV